MKKQLFFTVFFLFLLVPASITWAQSTETVKGLVKTNLSTSQTKITVYLPDDIRPGDMISGTVMAEPKGQSTKSKERSLNEVKNFHLKIDDPSDSKQSPLRFISANANYQYTMSLPSFAVTNGTQIFLKGEGGQILEIPLPGPGKNFREVKLSSFFIPSHVLTASPLNILGPFDGDFSNTSCMLDGKAVSILAESPRQCIIEVPDAGTGIHELTVKENGAMLQKKINTVELKASAGKLNLMKGESTYLDVLVSGLEGLNDTAVLSVSNQTKNTVTMNGGNNQVFLILPSDSLETFSRHFEVQSLRKGSFAIHIDLDLPQPVALYNIFCDDECSPTGSETDAQVGEVAISSSEKSNPDDESGALKTAKWVVNNTDLFGATGNEESAIDAAITAARTRGYVVWVKYCWKRCEQSWLCKYWEKYCGSWIPVVWVDGLENSGNNTFTATGGRAADDKSKVQGLTRKQILELAIKVGNDMKKK